MIKSGSSHINEAMTIKNMTKGMADGYSGIWTLPSGKPGLWSENDDIELVCLGEDNETQVIMTTEDGDTYYASFSSESKAVDTFKKIVSEYNKDPGANGVMPSPKTIAKKFGLR